MRHSDTFHLFTFQISVFDHRRSERSGYPDAAFDVAAAGEPPPPSLRTQEPGRSSRELPGKGSRETFFREEISGGSGVPEVLTAESVAAAAGDVASSLIVSPPPAIQPRQVLGLGNLMNFSKEGNFKSKFSS